MMEDFVSAYTNFKSILCICPKCNLFSRLSQLRIFSAEKTQTWVDQYEEKMRVLDKQITEHSLQQKKLKNEIIMKAREKLPALVRKALSSQIVNSKYNPYDINVVNHPVDFVVYNGMENGNVEDVVFLHSKNKIMEELHKSIHKTIENKQYDWKVARVSKDGELEFED